MPDPSKQQVIAQIKTVVREARWAGFTTEEIKAIFLAAVLETEGKL
jgi:uncharacterized protein (UPF0335 family)